MTELNPDKGHANGSCNRTACQAPLAHESEHQFMAGNFTGGPRLHYCAECAAVFDSWDFRLGDRVRITREPKKPDTTEGADIVQRVARQKSAGAPQQSGGVSADG